MAARFDYCDLKTLQERSFFFDANILIYLFWPSASRWEADYSQIYGRLLKQKNILFVDFLVISEVINRAHRIEYDKCLKTKVLTKNDLSYKTYRDSPDGQQAMSDIYLIIESNVISHFHIVGKKFSKNDIISYLSVNNLDFTDKAIVDICKENDLVLLTNDRDFKNVDLDILTSNPAIK